MPKTTSSKSSNHDALDLLMQDHKNVIHIFSQFEKLKDKSDTDKKLELVQQACRELSLHTQVEEEFFYPALRSEFDDEHLALLDEAMVEHNLAKQLILDLQSMQPDSKLYDAKFTVLGEYIKHHIDEETNEIFPKAKRAKIDLKQMGEDILQRKAELMVQIGMQPENEQESPTPTSSARSREKNSHLNRP